MTFFSEILKEKFLSGQSNQFLLYGNVKDIYPLNSEYMSLIEYLNSFLKKTNRIQIHFNIAKGIQFFSNKDQEVVKSAYIKSDFIGGTRESRERWFKKVLIESAVYPQAGIKFIDECLKLKVSDETNADKCRQFSIIIDYAETIAPAGSNERLKDSDRQKIVMLSELLTSKRFISSPGIIIFICDTIASFNERIINLPSMTLLQIPRPDENGRLNFIRFQYNKMNKKVKLKCSQQKLANLSAGLSFKGIQHLFLSAQYNSEKLDEKNVLKITNEILKKELGDSIEIFSPSHKMSDVIGAVQIKKLLNEQKKLIKSGNSELYPTGILVSGPNGVGKTFIFEAFAGELGYNIIKLKQIRSQWFGQTDIIFEKIKSVLTGIGKVLVFIDEADTFLGGRSQNTHETEKRLFGNLIQMMGDPENRGKIIWVLITARPDKLEPDIKRSGRAGLHIPVFDPEGKERIEFIKWILKKSGIIYEKLTSHATLKFIKLTKNYSPADFNELSIFIKSKSLLHPEKKSVTVLTESAEDFKPADISKERRYQIIIAALECSFISLIPEDLRDFEKLKVECELLKNQLRY